MMKTPPRGLLALLLLPFLAGPCVAGLLAHYSFDSDFSDASGNGNHLTIGAGTPTITSTSGEVAFGGGALDLNSTTSDQHYLDLATPLSFGVGDAWSVAFWARHRPGNDGRTGMVVGDLTSNDFIWIPRDGAVDGFRFRNSSGASTDYVTPPAGVEPAGVYHHWAVVADGAGNLTVYYDNDVLGSGSATTTFEITSVGQAFNGALQSMNGQIDELYIYDEAIDAATVNQLFTGATGPDTTPPTLVPADIVDNRGGGPVSENSLVTYTLTFSEDMDEATVTAADFGNAGTASFSIGAVSETSPGVFSVPVTPTSTGTLQLQVNAGAVLADPAGNALDTTAAIADDTTLTVDPADTTPPALSGGDMIDDQSGGPVVSGTLVTYTVTFSEDMDDQTVDPADFGNAGSATFTIGAVTETSPGVFSVEITPTSAGTLQLEVPAGAVLEDAAGNPLDTSAAITAAGTITVQAGFDPNAVKLVRVFLLGGQSNADGRADPSGLPTSPVNLQQPQDDVDFYEGSLTTLRPVGSQFGPEITWGRCLADSLGDGLTTRVAIIKYAVGGTSLAVDWKGGGDATTTGDGSRYVTFQNVVGNGLAALGSAYPNAALNIEGMLWVQGERDVVTGAEDEYEANLTAFIADMRDTYGAALPFIISRLSSGQTSLSAAGLGVVRAAQTAVAAADPFSALVDTDGFGMKADNLHFDALGQQQIGNAACLQTLNFYPFLSSPVLGVGTGGDLGLVLEQAFPGFLYTLYGNPGLDPGGWAELDAVTAGGSVVTFRITPHPGAERQFYRVGRSLP